MEDRLDSYFADGDSGDEVFVEEDYLEEEIAGWRPEVDDGADDDDDDQVCTKNYLKISQYPILFSEGCDRPPCCWPKNRDARLIKSGFHQSQNAPKLAFLGTAPSQTLHLVVRGTPPPYTPPSSAPRSSRLRLSTRLALSVLDLEAYGTSALGGSIPPSHTFWIRPCISQFIHDSQIFTCACFA